MYMEEIAIPHTLIALSEIAIFHTLIALSDTLIALSDTLIALSHTLIALSDTLIALSDTLIGFDNFLEVVKSVIKARVKKTRRSAQEVILCVYTGDCKNFIFVYFKLMIFK